MLDRIQRVFLKHGDIGVISWQAGTVPSRMLVRLSGRLNEVAIKEV